MTGPRPCPRPRCPGHQHAVEQGNLNGIDVTYWDCSNPDCGYTERTESNPLAGEQPTLEA